MGIYHHYHPNNVGMVIMKQFKETHNGNFIIAGVPFFVSIVDGTQVVRMETILWAFPDFDNPTGCMILENKDLNGNEYKGILATEFIDTCVEYSLRDPESEKGKVARKLLRHFTRHGLSLFNKANKEN